MKLNTLLLTSAATLMATSVAFAADLPSKKAAPSSGAVQVCKVGGMTGWTLPGSDTCVSLGGWVRANYRYDLNSADDDGALNWDVWTGSYRVTLDARSNTEVGVVRGVGRLTDGNLDKAYIQFAGVTAGMKDSIADIFGTNSIAFGEWSQGAAGIDYKMSAGGLTFGIGAETPVNNNWGGGDIDGDTWAAAGVGDRPDLVAHVSGKVGMVDFAAAAVSHEARGYGPEAEFEDPAANTDGYALLGRLGVSMNNVSVYGWGGMAVNASGYTGGFDETPNHDANFGDLESNVMGIGATFTQGAITVGAEFARYHSEYSNIPTMDEDQDALAVFATYKIAKNLSITGEYHTSSTDYLVGEEPATADVDTFYVRIQRDF